MTAPNLRDEWQFWCSRRSCGFGIHHMLVLSVGVLVHVNQHNTRRIFPWTEVQLLTTVRHSLSQGTPQSQAGWVILLSNQIIKNINQYTYKYIISSNSVTLITQSSFPSERHRWWSSVSIARTLTECGLRRRRLSDVTQLAAIAERATLLISHRCTIDMYARHSTDLIEVNEIDHN